MNQSKMRINLATMSRVVLDETPALEQLIQHFSWGLSLVINSRLLGLQKAIRRPTSS